MKTNHTPCKYRQEEESLEEKRTGQMNDGMRKTSPEMPLELWLGSATDEL